MPSGLRHPVAREGYAAGGTAMEVAGLDVWNAAERKGIQTDEQISFSAVILKHISSSPFSAKGFSEILLSALLCEECADALVDKETILKCNL